MGLATFKGGVHPYEGKELSESKPTQLLMPKGDLVYPMSQHIGAPAKPLVKKGDRVLVGQKIGEAGGFVSANIISSVSGTVKAVEPRRVSSGGMVTSVVVENDGEYQEVEGMGADRDPATLSKQEIRNIAENGPKSEDIEKTREYLAKQWKNSLEQNGSWMGYIQELNTVGNDYLADYEQTLRSITDADVQALAKKVLADNNLVRVVMRPAPAAEK